MKRLFLDSSVLFSAAYSARGYSRDLVLMTARSEIILTLSDLVIEEVRQNLAESAPEAVAVFDYLLGILPIEIVKPDREDVLEAASYIVLKDAPILAAARKARADLLVTLDKKHMLGKPDLASWAGMKIVTPREAVAFVRGDH